MFAAVNFAARKGLADAPGEDSAKQRARRTGYILVARNYTAPGLKGEIDMVGYDGPVLAFVEVKTRSASDPNQPKPEDAVNWEKRRNLTRMARQFLRARRVDEASCRFDVLAIETQPGARPQVRLHKGAFGIGAH